MKKVMLCIVWAALGFGCASTRATTSNGGADSHEEVEPTMSNRASATSSEENKLTKEVGEMSQTQTTKREQVRALLKSLETGEQAPVAVINPQKYIQHNLDVADGLAGFGAFLSEIPPGSIKVNTVRIFSDGDYVFAHSEYNLLGPKVGFDIFRFENGRIVEHWDNLATTASLNPSGHSQIDGPTEVTDLDKTSANKKLVKSFVETVLINNKMETLGEFFDGDNYIQHNPDIADGVSGLGAALEALAKQGIKMVYANNHFVLGEGNFVLSVSDGSFGGKPVAFYDLFRVSNQKIAEHWDVIADIPSKEMHKNSNGKF